MNYKELFNRVVLFISAPAKAWLDVKNETDGRKVMGEFVYPLIGLYKNMLLGAQLGYQIKLFGGILSTGVQIGFVDDMRGSKSSVIKNKLNR